MAKIVGIVITMLLLNVAMFVFTFTGDCGVDGCDIEEYNTEANSTIWDYFTNPQDQTESSFWQRLFSSTTGILGLATLAGVAVVAGLYLTKDINVIYISLMIFLVGGAIATWVRLYNLVNNESFIIGGSSGGVVALIVVGCLLAAQLFNSVDWGRGKD